MPVSFKSEAAEKRARRAIDKLVAVLGLTDDGKVTLGFDGEYDTATGIIADALRFHPDVRMQERVGMVKRAVVDARKADDLSLGTVIRNASSGQTKYLKRPKAPFVLATTISIRYDDCLATVRFEGAHITFSRSLPRRFALGERAKRFLRDVKREAWYSTVRVRINARDDFTAGEMALNRLDALRALWNLYFNRGTRRLLLGATVAAQNSIVLGRLSTLHRPSGEPLDNRLWWHPYRIEDPRPLDIGRSYSGLKRFESQLRDRLRRAPFRGQLVGLLVRYAHALDEHDPSSAFLKLWSVLEDITHTSTYDRTIKRASFLFEDSTYARLELDHLRTWRNRFVHDGTPSDDSDHFLQQLRYYVEHLLAYLIVHAPAFEGLDEFGEFLHLTPDYAALARKRKQVELAHALYRETR